VNAGSINQNNLSLGLGDYTLDLETGCLWRIGNCGNLLADESVEQRRLAGIWPADKGDVPTAVVLLGRGFGQFYLPFSAKIWTR
jgi:hypothetical protein